MEVSKTTKAISPTHDRSVGETFTVAESTYIGDVPLKPRDQFTLVRIDDYDYFHYVITRLNGSKWDAICHFSDLPDTIYIEE